MLKTLNRGREKNSGDDFSDQTYNDDAEAMFRYRDELRHLREWEDVCYKSGRDPGKPCREMPMALRRMHARKAWLDENKER
jgi:hypothetical protein